VTDFRFLCASLFTYLLFGQVDASSDHHRALHALLPPGNAQETDHAQVGREPLNVPSANDHTALWRAQDRKCWRNLVERAVLLGVWYMLHDDDGK